MIGLDEVTHQDNCWSDACWNDGVTLIPPSVVALHCNQFDVLIHRCSPAPTLSYLGFCLQQTKPIDNQHQAITKCAKDLNPAWFKPHCIRMASPTTLRAAGGSLGWWKSVPTSLVYHGSSTKSNNRVLQLIADPMLFASLDIVLSRVLPPTKENRQPTVRRF